MKKYSCCEIYLYFTVYLDGGSHPNKASKKRRCYNIIFQKHLNFLFKSLLKQCDYFLSFFPNNSLFIFYIQHFRSDYFQSPGGAKSKISATQWSWYNLNKSALDISPPPLLKFSENWLLATPSTNLSRIHEKRFQLSRPQGQTIDVKSEKSKLIGDFDFSSAIIEHVQ